MKDAVTAIYIDNARHIICLPYTVEHLHAAAKMLGIKRHWFHGSPYPHYDMPKKWTMARQLEMLDRQLDVEDMGVEIIEVSPRKLVRIIREELKRQREQS